MASGSNNPADTRAKAEARFHLAERRKTEADQAVTEAQAARTAEAQKTVRLKALRLAKEEADRAAAAAASPAKGPAKRRSRAAAKA